jgi:serine/threonine protein phosphatase PrpC
MIKTILMLIMLNTTLAKLRFIVRSFSEGAVLEDTDGKDKYLNVNIGEDNISTTPYGLAVSDGVGSCHFSSHYASKVLTTAFAKFFVDENQPKSLSNGDQYYDAMMVALASGMTEFQRKLNEYMIDNILRKTLPESKVEKLVNLLSVSATLVATQIDNSEFTPESDKANMMIYTKGDSLVTVFRKTPHPEKEGFFYYKPILMTTDQQYRFNQPYQFTSSVDIKNIFHDSHFNSEIHADDIVLLGSDGIYDNMHLSLLTMIVNYCFWLSHAEDLSKTELHTVITFMVNEYIKNMHRDQSLIKTALDGVVGYKEHVEYPQSTTADEIRYSNAYPGDVKFMNGYLIETKVEPFSRFPELLEKLKSAQQPEEANNGDELNRTAESIYFSDGEELEDDDLRTTQRGQQIEGEVEEEEEENDLFKSIYIPPPNNEVLNNSQYKPNKISIDFGRDFEAEEEIDNTEQESLLKTIRPPKIDVDNTSDEVSPIKFTKESAEYYDLFKSRYIPNESSKVYLDDLEEENSKELVLPVDKSLTNFDEIEEVESNYDVTEENSFDDFPENKDSNDEEPNNSLSNELLSSSRVRNSGWVTIDDDYIAEHFSGKNGLETEIIEPRNSLDNESESFTKLTDKSESFIEILDDSSDHIPIDESFENKMANSGLLGEIVSATSIVLDDSIELPDPVEEALAKINQKPDQPQITYEAIKNMLDLKGNEFINKFELADGLAPHLDGNVLKAITNTFAFSQKHINTVFKRIDPSAFSFQIAHAVKYIYKSDQANPNNRVLSPFYQRYYLLNKNLFTMLPNQILSKKDDISVVAGFVELETEPQAFHPTVQNVEEQFEQIWAGLKTHVDEFLANIKNEGVDSVIRSFQYR